MPESPVNLTSERTTGLNWLMLVLLAAPFYLNDFASIHVQDWRLWLLIDYTAVKLFPLALVLGLIVSQKLAPAELGLTTPSLPVFLFVFLIAGVSGTLIDQNGYRLMDGLPGYAPLGGMPAITNAAWNWIDLTLGLLLVAAVEELVFRGYLCAFLRRFTESAAVIVLTSSIAFGLIHWSLGLHAVLITSIIGAVFMVIYLKTRSLPPIMLAHFAVNFIDFAGVMPKSIFKLL